MAPAAKTKAKNESFLSRDEERALIAAWQLHGDHRARSRLVEAYQPMILAKAKSLKRHDIFDDLVSTGNIALLEAIDRYDLDHSGKVGLFAYAGQAIQGVMWVATRSFRSAATFNESKISKLCLTAIDGQGKDPARLHQLRQNYPLEVELAEAALLPPKVITSNPSDLEIRTGQAVDLVDPVDSFITLESEMLIPRQRAALNDLISALTPREEVIIREIDLSDPPVKARALAKRFGVSPQRIQQQHVVALRKLLIEAKRMAVNAFDLLPD